MNSRSTLLAAFLLCPPADVAWAALWGLMDRKYFWDFVGGSLGPHGIVYVVLLGASRNR